MGRWVILVLAGLLIGAGLGERYVWWLERRFWKHH